MCSLVHVFIPFAICLVVHVFIDFYLGQVSTNNPYYSAFFEGCSNQPQQVVSETICVGIIFLRIRDDKRFRYYDQIDGLNQLEDLFYCKDLHEPIEGRSAKPSNVTDGDWERLKRKAIGHIRQWLEISVIHHISQETDAYILWEKLEGLYARKTAQNKAFTIRKLVNLKYKEGRPVVEHLNDFHLVNQ